MEVGEGQEKKNLQYRKNFSKINLHYIKKTMGVSQNDS